VRQVWRCICHTTTPLGVWGWGGAGNSSNGEVWQKKASRQGSSALGSNLVLTFQLRMEPRNNNITTVITAWPHPAVLGAGLSARSVTASIAPAWCSISLPPRSGCRALVLTKPLIGAGDVLAWCSTPPPRCLPRCSIRHRLDLAAARRDARSLHQLDRQQQDLACRLYYFRWGPGTSTPLPRVAPARWPPPKLSNFLTPTTTAVNRQPRRPTWPQKPIPQMH
jgi:hypothetical protein